MQPDDGMPWSYEGLVPATDVIRDGARNVPDDPRRFQVVASSMALRKGQI